MLPSSVFSVTFLEAQFDALLPPHWFFHSWNLALGSFSPTEMQMPGSPIRASSTNNFPEGTQVVVSQRSHISLSFLQGIVSQIFHKVYTIKIKIGHVAMLIN